MLLVPTVLRHEAHERQHHVVGRVVEVAVDGFQQTRMIGHLLQTTHRDGEQLPVDRHRTEHLDRAGNTCVNIHRTVNGAAATASDDLLQFMTGNLRQTHNQISEGKSLVVEGLIPFRMTYWPCKSKTHESNQRGTLDMQNANLFARSALHCATASIRRAATAPASSCRDDPNHRIASLRACACQAHPPPSACGSFRR